MDKIKQKEAVYNENFAEDEKKKANQEKIF